MKTIFSVSALVLLVLLLAGPAQAAGRSLAATIDVYVFPSEGQDESQQSKDEATCYNWAVDNTGSDPFDLMKQQRSDEQQTQAEKQAAGKTGQGSGVRGAARGAAMGALIGGIAGDAGTGAAWGAGVGGLGGRRRGAMAQHEAKKQASERAEKREQATAEQIDNFKKAFSVCLEAKDYMVKY